jgi:hypothetical protein
MAIFHCQLQIISRGKGRSAVAAAAYRSGERVVNERDGIVHDYTRKGGVVHTEILPPDYAPKEYANRAILWNAVEKIEKAGNAQLSREVELALPKELTLEQQIRLVRSYCQRQFMNWGMCADICVHDKKDGNPHAHVMLTMRPFNKDGSWGTKQRKEYILDGDGNKIYDPKKKQYKCRSVESTDWNNRDNCEKWRAAWADYVNAFLEGNRIDGRVDHRSYERQGIEQIPTVHLGVAAFQMERRGIRTELGDRNREIQQFNSRLGQFKARIRKLEDWAKAERKAPPTLWEVFSNIHNQHKSEPRTNAQSIANLKLMTQTFNFIQDNDIETLDDMAAAVQKLRNRYNDIKLQNTKDNRRWGVLEKHIRQAENYGKHRAAYNKWRKMKEDSPQANAYYKKHSEEISAFAEAFKYLDRHLNGHKQIPLDAWKREFAELKSRRTAAIAESDRLAVELRSAETIKRNADIVMGVESHKRSRGLEI